MELGRLDLNLLVILEGLLQEHSITRVAERLELSQPTVSAALGRLRVALKDELFVRSHGAMHPTERAMQLREPVQRILRVVRHEILTTVRFDPTEVTGPLIICASDVGELEFLPGLIARISVQAPKASVICVVRDPHALANDMEEGEIDLAVGYFPDLQTAVFKQQVLFSHDSVCVVRREHPVYGHGITLEQYREARHLIVSQDTRTQDVIDQALVEHGIVRKVALTISHFVNVPQLIANTDLVATVARPIAQTASQFFPITLLPPPFRIPSMQIKQVWHRRFDKSPRLIWLRNLIADMSQNKPNM
jgi:DNA-binding transcriptional LysR family regulator